MSEAAAMTHFTEEEKKRFELLDKACIEGRSVFFLTALALGEIRDHKLYMIRGFKTFGDYAESIGFTRRYCDQLILDAAAIKNLPPKLRELVKNDSAARALAKIPEVLRPAVVEQASGGGKKKVTAVDIKKTGAPTIPPRKKKVTPPAPKRKPEPKPAPKEMDETGIEIPPEILPEWMRAREDARSFLWNVAAALEALKSRQEKKDQVFCELDFNSDIANLSQVKVDIERALPYAVCTSCNGKLSKDCTECKGRGFFSKFHWKTFVPQEIKQLRPKGWKE